MMFLFREFSCEGRILWKPEPKNRTGVSLHGVETLTANERFGLVLETNITSRREVEFVEAF